MLATIGAIVGPQDGEVPAPSPQAPGAAAPAPRIMRVAIGEAGEDGGVTFRVRRIREAGAVRLRADRGGNPLTPGDNRSFVVAEVEVVNRSTALEDPFCGSGGTTLYVAAGEAVEPIEDL